MDYQINMLFITGRSGGFGIQTESLFLEHGLLDLQIRLIGVLRDADKNYPDVLKV